MSRKRRLSVLAVALLLLGAACRNSSPEKPPPKVAAPDSAVVAEPVHPSDDVAHPEIGFASQRKLREHYEKHGSELGAISKEEYLRQAQMLRDRPAGGDILEVKRSDGVVTRFDRKTGAFVAFDRDLTIRTYFRPNDGERYFLRQARRQPGDD
jgi:pyocin large subunit-like protein